MEPVVTEIDADKDPRPGERVWLEVAQGEPLIDQEIGGSHCRRKKYGDKLLQDPAAEVIDRIRQGVESFPGEVAKCQLKPNEHEEEWDGLYEVVHDCP